MSIQMRKHLLDKEKLAKEHMCHVSEHIQKLTETYRELQNALTRTRGKVEVEFRNLQAILQQKKEAVLEKLDTSVSTQQETLRSYTQHAEKVTVDVTKALDDAHVLASEKNQKSFLAEYSKVAQSLEQVVVDMLLLGEYMHLTEGISCGAKILESMEVDVGIFIHTTDTLEAIIDDIFHPCGDEKEEGKENCELARGWSSEVEELQVIPTRRFSESVNNSGGVMTANLQCMELTEGSIIQVLITSVHSPSEFCAQPYSPLLIELKNQISYFYRDLTAKNVKKFEVLPAVGDYCCARFSEDKCWYRAVVTAVDRNSGRFQGKTIHSNVLVSVVYVDYGNEESLPLSELRQLDCSFSSLSCQALYCSMPRIKPLASPSSHDREAQVWPASVCRWFRNVMLGKPLHISIICSDKQNNCDVDVHVPWNVLYSPESLKSLPKSPKCVQDYKGKSQSSPIALSLANFMMSVGLGAPCTSGVSSCEVQTELCEKPEMLQASVDNHLLKSHCVSHCPDNRCELIPSADRKCEIDTNCVCSELHRSSHMQAAIFSSGSGELNSFTSDPLDTATMQRTENNRSNIRSLESLVSSDITGSESVMPSHCKSVEPSHDTFGDVPRCDRVQCSLENSNSGPGTLLSSSMQADAEELPRFSSTDLQTSCKSDVVALSKLPNNMVELLRSQLKLFPWHTAHHSGSSGQSVGMHTSLPSDNETVQDYSIFSHANGNFNERECNSTEEQIPELSPPCSASSPDTFIGTLELPISVEAVQCRMSLFSSESVYKAGSCTVDSTNPAIGQNELQRLTPAHALVLHSDVICSRNTGNVIDMELEKKQSSPQSMVQTGSMRTDGSSDMKDYRNKCTVTIDDKMQQQACCLFKSDIAIEPHRSQEIEAKCFVAPEIDQDKIVIRVCDNEETLARFKGEMEFQCESEGDEKSSSWKTSRKEDEVELQQETLTKLKHKTELELHIENTGHGLLSNSSLHNQILETETQSEDETECHADNLTRLSSWHTYSVEDEKCFIKAEYKDELQIDFLTASEGGKELLSQSSFLADSHVWRECTFKSEIEQDSLMIKSENEMELQAERKEVQIELYQSSSIGDSQTEQDSLMIKSENEMELQAERKEVPMESSSIGNSQTKQDSPVIESENEMELQAERKEVQIKLYQSSYIGVSQTEQDSKSEDEMELQAERNEVQIESSSIGDSQDSLMIKSENEMELQAERKEVQIELYQSSSIGVSQIKQDSMIIKSENEMELQAERKEVQIELFQSSSIGVSQIKQDSMIIKSENEMELQAERKEVQIELYQSSIGDSHAGKEFHSKCSSMSETKQDSMKPANDVKLQDGEKQLQTDTLLLLVESKIGSEQQPETSKSCQETAVLDMYKSTHEEGMHRDSFGIERKWQFKAFLDPDDGMESQLVTANNLKEFKSEFDELLQGDTLNKLDVENQLQFENLTSSDNEEKLQPEVGKEFQHDNKILIETLTKAEDGKDSYTIDSCAVGQKEETCFPLIIDLDRADTTCEMDEKNTPVIALPLPGISTHQQATATQNNCSAEAAIELLSWESLGQSKSIVLGTLGDFTVLISHVNSPSQFYVHPVQPDTAHELDQLISSMSQHYSIEENSIPLCRLQYDIGTVCCVRSAHDGLWYRGIVMERDVDTSDTCSVLFVDFGDIQLVDKKCVFVLNQMFVNTPIQCLCCSLCGIKPLSGGTSDRGITLGKEVTDSIIPVPSYVWPPEVNASFQSMVSGKQLVAYIANCGHNCFQYNTMQKVAVDVNLFDTSGKSDIDIGTLLVMQGAADWSEEDGVIKLQNWNPMESDFLNRRNNYKIDDEDAQLALHGYNSTSSRPCRYFNTPQGCARGNECTFSHLKEDQCDFQLQDTFIRDCGTVEMTLPSVGDWVVVLVTAVISPTRFFVQLPLGNTNLFSSSQKDNDSVEESRWYQTVELLIEEMSLHYSSKAFSDIEVFEPHIGEIVAAQYSVDEQWYRARVVDVFDQSVQVFFVDFGNVEMVSPMDIRTILDKFMHCPFQALECCLSNLLCNDHDSKLSVMPFEAKRLFVNLVTDHLLVAEIIWRGYDSVLGLNLFYADDPDEKTEQHLNKSLVEKGIARWIEEPSVAVTDNVKLFPG